jgi:hypothetical protein
VHQLLIHFKKAYDSVRREVLNNILYEFGISLKLVRLAVYILFSPSSHTYDTGHVKFSVHFKTYIKNSVTKYIIKSKPTVL